MNLKLAVMAVGGTVILSGAAFSGTPFGGDDTGTIPSDSPKGPVTKCEVKVGKAVAKLVGAVIKCHGLRATGKLADDTAEDGCESAAQAKFNATKTTGCAPCTNLQTIGSAVVGLIDGNNNKVYCTSTGTPFGGDDTGNIPPDSPKGPITKCENVVAKAVGKLVSGISACHALRASGKLTSDSAEDACEQKALTTFNATKTTGCDSCTNLSSTGNFVEMTADQSNAIVYCGSPSGAFLDAARP